MYATYRYLYAAYIQIEPKMEVNKNTAVHTSSHTKYFLNVIQPW